MFTRFANPHLSSSSSTHVSRKDLELYEEAEFIPDKEDLETLDSCLETLIQPSSQPREQKKCEQTCSEAATDIAPFRLFSLHEPQVIDLRTNIRLNTPHTGNAVIWEPSHEDTKAQAKERRRKALAAAIDPMTLLKEAQRNSQGVAESSAVPILILESRQPPRKTRPPVDPSRLAHHPYSSDTLDPSLENIVRACPTLTMPDTTDSTKSRRNRRSRPQPTFWRPPPNAINKCMGYAMGYPSSWGKYDNPRR